MNSQLQSQQFAVQINNIKTTFFSALDDFKKYYILVKTTPESPEYKNYYANSKSQLQTSNSEMFILTNELEKKISALNSQIELASLKLINEKKLNGELTTSNSGFENTHYGSVIMINDAKTEYNLQYFNNWQYIMAILIISMSIFIESRKNNV